MQEVNSLFNDIRYIKGVGPKRALDFNLLGVSNLRDLLYLFPRRYEDRRIIKKISELNPGDIAAIRGEVRRTNLRRSRSNIAIYEAVIDDDSSNIHISWFNQPYLQNVIKKGSDIVLYGKVDLYKGLRMNSPDYEILISGDPDLGIVSVYPLSGRLTQKFIRKLVCDQLERYKESIKEFIPDFIINRYSIMGRVDALINLHLPQDIDITEKARYRLAFEDIFMIQIAIGMKRVKRRFLEQGVSHNFTPDTMLDFKNALPFGLTEAQERVLRNIEKDMRAPSPMNRLLQGEVGTGKTVVAAYASLLSASGNYQTAIMVPTEILAQQQYVKISEFLSPFNIETGLLIGGLEKDCRREIVGDIASGEISVVVGTHALLQEDVEFNNLGLIVVDEQHKFGVQQRRILKKKGSAPDYLIMTATPIPRTLALTIFGDMDISTIRETPFGEKKISTYWVGTKRRRYVYSFLKELVDSGAQGFMVCPRIEESEDELRNVQEAYRDLESLLGPDRVALLHGKMSGEDKKKIIDEFKKGEISVLVSTIVIEVGIDVPDASIIIIEDADRFGLSQLHQLRGRVGRASQNAYCILLADPKTGEAYKRLNAIVSIEDGFRISEEDLKIRGSGEILGIRQHGFISTESLQLAYQNADLLESIRGEAFELLERDPFLKDLANRALAEELKSRFRFL
ncbi:MAG: ATP-dependent DNA helicase RecG [Candidatus Kaelpia aquatica]|nr:ATP-dependent DNA helicase RecG [Candidatus Kaelpia aquatica]